MYVITVDLFFCVCILASNTLFKHTPCTMCRISDWTSPVVFNCLTRTRINTPPPTAGSSPLSLPEQSLSVVELLMTQQDLKYHQWLMLANWPLPALLASALKVKSCSSIKSWWYKISYIKLRAEEELKITVCKHLFLSFYRNFYWLL